MISLEAGVSQATVSRALKNDARISAAVRSRIQAIATRMGYRPDPQVSKLMAHMRSMRETQFQTLLGFILPLEEYQNTYMRDMLCGARARAETLGYVVNELRSGMGKKDIRALNRVLRARGVEGIVLSPRTGLEPAPDGLDLTHIAAVSCASFEEVLPVHQVRSGHFTNMSLLLEEMKKKEWKRPGLVTWQDFDRRQRWAPRMGYYHYYHDLLGETPPPIFDWHEHIDRAAPAFLEWFREQQPDGLLVVSPIIVKEINHILSHAKIRKKIPMLCIGHTPAGSHGINEKPVMIGSAAVDILTSHILRNETGWPSDVKMMSLQGELR